MEKISKHVKLETKFTDLKLGGLKYRFS